MENQLRESAASIDERGACGDHQGYSIHDTGTLRILMVTPRYLPEMGGIEIHVYEVGRRLAEKGHSITVLTTDRNRQFAVEEIAAGVRIKRVGAWPKNADYYFAPGIYREIMNGDWDVIHFQGCHTFVAPIGMIAANRKRLPFVITFHSGGHSSRLRNALRNIQWLVLGPLVRRASHWIGVSKFEAELFSAKMKLPRESFVVVPNGAEMAHAVETPRKQSRLIISIGRLERYKGHHRVIEAFQEVLRRMPDAKLRILGEGPYKKQLLALIERLNLQADVAVGGIPAAERDRLASILKGASLVVLLSEYEAHPVAVMEALALGRPVLTTNGSGFIEMVEQGFVRSVPIDASPSQVAEAILEQLLDNRSGALCAIELPSWNRCADRLLEIYRSVACNPR